MKQLLHFYEWEGRLLYATGHFLGYDPLVGPALRLPRTDKPGEAEARHAFTLGGDAYEAVLTSGPVYGPGRGYRQAEVFRQGERLLSTRSGGGGASYTGAPHYRIEGPRALLLVEGNALRDFSAGVLYGDLDPDAYYLLLFEGISRPVHYPVDADRAVPQKELYTRQEVEPYRQKTWEGALDIPGGTVQVAHWEAPGFCLRYSGGGVSIYNRCKGIGFGVPRKKELSISGRRYVFESSW